MINIAVLGRRGSGKTTFLLSALAPYKIGILDEVGESYQYFFQNGEEQKIFSKKLKELSKGNFPEPTVGANEARLGVGTDSEDLGEISLWEIGGNLSFAHTDEEFEKKLTQAVADMVGGRCGVSFDGYIFFEEAQNFGISTGVSFASFSKRFSEYLALAEKVRKPVLMICTKRSRRSNEEVLSARFRDNFKLRIKAHYAFLDFDLQGKDAILNSKYILTRFLAQSFDIKDVAFADCLYNYFLNLKECVDYNKGMM